MPKNSPESIEERRNEKAHTYSVSFEFQLTFS